MTFGSEIGGGSETTAEVVVEGFFSAHDLCSSFPRNFLSPAKASASISLTASFPSLPSRRAFFRPTLDASLTAFSASPESIAIFPRYLPVSSSPCRIFLFLIRRFSNCSAVSILRPPACLTILDLFENSLLEIVTWVIGTLLHWRLGFILSDLTRLNCFRFLMLLYLHL